MNGVEAGNNLSGKAAIVVGGYTHLGKGIALALARAGAQIGILARTGEKIEEACREVRACGVQGVPLVTDVTDEGQVVDAFQHARKTLGHIDTMVYNTGVRPDGRMPVKDMDLRVWRELIDTNLTGAMLCCREAVRHMADQETGGTVVTIGSTAGIRAVPGIGHYSASKAGLLSLTQAVAGEMGRENIRANYIALGAVEGPRTRRALEAMAKSKGSTVEEELALRTNNALGRLVTLNQLTDLVVFLVSDRSGGMTGQAFNLSANV